MFSDASLREAYDELLRAVRSRLRGIRFPYRCDSSSERRLYVLRVTPRPDGGLHFTTRLLQRQARAPQPGWEVSRSAVWATWEFCSQCNQVRLHPVGWCEIEEISSLALFKARGTPRFRPTMCPRCLRSLRACAVACGSTSTRP
jgi:hypothetical protein